MDFTSVQIKEAVEVIESSIPGGSRVTAVVLSLVVLALGIWTSLYILHAALEPIAHAVTSLVQGTEFHVPISIGGVVDLILISAVGWYFVDTVMTVLRKNVEQTGQVLDIIANLNKCVQMLMDRVAALEKAAGKQT